MHHEAHAADDGAGSSSTTQELLNRLRAHFRARRQELRQELKSYPRPIAGCDLQYQHLVAVLDELREELARLDAIAAQSATEQQRSAAIVQFIRSSRHVDDAGLDLVPAARE